MSQFDFERQILTYMESVKMQLLARPLNLGGVAGADGGGGGPAGGIVGVLPQTKIAYDTTEAGSNYTPVSGYSLLDNLNHIRYRLHLLEIIAGSGTSGGHTIYKDGVSFPQRTNLSFDGSNITVIDDAIGDTTHITFSGSSGVASPLFQTLTTASTINWDLSLGNAQVTLDTTHTLASPTNAQPGGMYFLEVTQNPGGNGVLNFDSNYRFSSVSKALGSGVSSSNIFLFARDTSFMNCISNSVVFPGESDSLPDTISNLYQWLKADALSLSDGDLVASWTDSSSNARHATQTDSSIQPVFRTNKVNGKPTLEFYNAGMNDNTSFYGDGSTVTLTISAVFSVDGASGDRMLFQTYSTGIGIQFFFGFNSYYGKFNVDNGYPMSALTAPVADRFYVATIRSRSGHSELRINGVLQSTSPQACFISELGIGAAITDLWSPASHLNGQVAEIVMYNKELNSTELGTLEAYLMHKYAIS